MRRASCRLMMKPGMLFLVCLITMIYLPCTAAIASAVDSARCALYVNGVLMSEDFPVVRREGRVLAYAEPLASALGLEVVYDPSVRTALVRDSTVTLREKEIPLSIDTLGKLFGVWMVYGDALQDAKRLPRPDAMFVYAGQMIPVGGTGLSIRAVANHRWEMEKDQALVGWRFAYPQLSGLGDAALEQQLNARFAQEFERVRMDTEAALLHTQEKPVAHWTEQYFDLSLGDNGLLSLILERYDWVDGTQGASRLDTVCIDPATSATLTLADLFAPGEDCEYALQSMLDSLWREGRGAYYAGVGRPTVAGHHAFFVEGENLVLVYHPQDLAYDTRGYIFFPISLKALQAHIKPEYRIPLSRGATL